MTFNSRSLRIIGFVAASSSMGWSACSRKESAQSEPPTIASTKALTADTVAPPLQVWLGGDLHWGHDDEAPWGDLERLHGGGIGIVNLEGPICDPDTQVAEEANPEPDGRATTVRLSNAASDRLAEAKRVGIRFVGIANNHANDCGQTGQATTADIIRRAGLLPVGGVAGPASLTENGRKLLVTATDLSGDAVPQLHPRPPDVDYWIATFHVTGPPSHLPLAELRKAANAAIKGGADIVAAHGTHAIGPVARIEGTPVLWGLGNLALACNCTDEVDGLIAQIRLGSDSPGVDEITLVPIDAGLHGRVIKAGHNPGLTFDLLEAIGSATLERNGGRASF